MNAIRPIPNGLYAIIDASIITPEKIEETTDKLVKGGVKIIQLRAKGLASGQMLNAAKKMRELTQKKGALLIINDRIDIAVMSSADGVHLGQDDIQVEDARKLVKDFIIGISAHSREEALNAESRGADYVSFGPIYATTTKKDAQEPKGILKLIETASVLRVPVVAIGGITEERAPEVMNAGAHCVAMISDILNAPDITRKARVVISKVKG